MARQHRRLFQRHGMDPRIGDNLSDSVIRYSDYWPLTVTPQATRPKRPKPWIVTIGALIALSAALTFAFRHGIPAL